MYKLAFLGFISSLIVPTVWANESPTESSDKTFQLTLQEQKQYDYPEWGLAALVRNASIPYSVDFGVEDSTVTTFFPMMFYNGEHIFLRGTEGGVHLYKHDDLELNAIIRNHFIDIPSSLQNSIGGDTTDYGAQLRYQLNDTYYTELDLMTDPNGTFHTVGSIGAQYHRGNWLVRPKASVSWRNKKYNNLYYNLGDETLDSGFDTKVGFAARYHVFDNLYLLGGAYGTYLNSEARKSASINDEWQSEVYLGFGFFNNVEKKYAEPLSLPEYIRVAHGWATPSNIGDILRLNRVKDEYNNKLTSVFYGYPLTDELFSLPLEIYLTPGFVWHWSSQVQDNLQEYVIAIKAYYTFQWPVRTRLGFAEGVSYINELTYIEQSEMDRKGYQGSEWLNYLDFTIDINLGDLFNEKHMRNVWLGYSIHHRSAIFESASQFGRIKGGSNYNTVYLQFDF
ncbi:MipA/OmpV family protein [Thalassotalea sp. LPB0316]|uniref:MipA/OmpV family protein n=1 Tax=Thalassotalea sp. LPB0316 TaxID=2769490 RepID=UPI001868A1B3|nr:MipA/OmpV family protein [Thalassotalea sp. LPB0316]QOL25074.1 MipA/OmpV family protein [Thalassotalea sp. LPB0316]